MLSTQGTRKDSAHRPRRRRPPHAVSYRAQGTAYPQVIEAIPYILSALVLALAVTPAGAVASQGPRYGRPAPLRRQVVELQGRRPGLQRLEDPDFLVLPGHRVFEHLVEAVERQHQQPVPVPQDEVTGVEDHIAQHHRLVER